MAFYKFIGSAAEFFPGLALVVQPGYVYDFGTAAPPNEPYIDTNGSSVAPTPATKWTSDPGPATDYRVRQATDIVGLLGAPPSQTVDTVASSGGAVTLPAPTTAAVHLVTLTANCTITLPAASTGASFVVETVQDATGGRTLTWTPPSGAIRWPGAATPSYTTAAGGRDLTVFECLDGSNWDGMVAAYDLR